MFSCRRAWGGGGGGDAVGEVDLAVVGEALEVDVAGAFDDPFGGGAGDDGAGLDAVVEGEEGGLPELGGELGVGAEGSQGGDEVGGVDGPEHGHDLAAGFDEEAGDGVVVVFRVGFVGGPPLEEGVADRIRGVGAEALLGADLGEGGVEVAAGAVEADPGGAGVVAGSLLVGVGGELGGGDGPGAEGEDELLAAVGGDGGAGPVPAGEDAGGGACAAGLALEGADAGVAGGARGDEGDGALDHAAPGAAEVGELVAGLGREVETLVVFWGEERGCFGLVGHGQVIQSHSAWASGRASV